MPDSRTKTGQFSKGQSGNPGGRKATPKEVKELLKAATVPMVKLLIKTANDKNVKIELRVRCAETIIERSLGKPNQPIDILQSDSQSTRTVIYLPEKESDEDD